MAGTTLDVSFFITPESEAKAIVDKYTTWKIGRDQKEAQWNELRKYIFATDTTTTTNNKLPWKNTTTRPKLCQIRDNLQANYMAALFPTERWFKWIPSTQDSATKANVQAIEAYMNHKFKESKFTETVARLVNDYIDYGNAIGDVEFANEITTAKDGSTTSSYTGPRLVRISPLDIVFDVTAPSFEQAPKITRTLLSLGQIEKLKVTNPDWAEVAEDVLEHIKRNRSEFMRNQASYTSTDIAKMDALRVDGFATVKDYYMSGFVEFLEFEGDYYDIEKGELLQNYVITVVDRCHVVRKAPISNWFGKSYKQHVGWRLRPDNLMAMGPLDNLVGLQYRLDHLENLKADVFDLIAFPIVKVKGYVEDFRFQPLERIFMEQDSDVEYLAPDTTALNADIQIERIEQTMEDMAGAPRQAMGVRTPGEKTAYEVQTLENASGRIFQNKTTYFEEHFLEPLINSMLEVARRNMRLDEVVSVIDDELGVQQFIQITPDMIKAKGKLVPMGARHFAAQAQMVQNLTNLANTPIYQDPMVQQHFSSKKIATLFEELLNIERFGIVRPYVRIEEALESQMLQQQAQEEAQVAMATPTETPEDLQNYKGPPQSQSPGQVAAMAAKGRPLNG